MTIEEFALYDNVSKCVLGPRKHLPESATIRSYFDHFTLLLMSPSQGSCDPLIESRFSVETHRDDNFQRFEPLEVSPSTGLLLPTFVPLRGIVFRKNFKLNAEEVICTTFMRSDKLHTLNAQVQYGKQIDHLPCQGKLLPFS